MSKAWVLHCQGTKKKGWKMPKLPSTFEKKWPTTIVSPIQVSNGRVIVADVSGLHTKQSVVLSKVGETPLEAEIKRILSDTEILVGPLGQKIQVLYSQAELQDYDGGTLTMSEQNRNPINSEYVLRAVYEEEPAVALRTVAVDSYGQHYTVDNPFPVKIEGITITVPGGISVQLTHLDDWPNLGDIHDSVRVGDGADILKIYKALGDPDDGSISIFDWGHTQDIRLQNRLLCSDDVERYLTWAEIDGVRRITKIEWVSDSIDTQEGATVKLTRTFTYQGADPFDLVSIDDVLTVV